MKSKSFYMIYFYLAAICNSDLNIDRRLLGHFDDSLYSYQNKHHMDISVVYSWTCYNKEIPYLISEYIASNRSVRTLYNSSPLLHCTSDIIYTTDKKYIKSNLEESAIWNTLCSLRNNTFSNITRKKLL